MNDYGPRLSAAEYQRRIAELYASPSEPTDEADRERRRRELDIRIDFRLGRDFPRERREALWQVQERIEKKRLGLAFRHFMRAMFHRLLMSDTKQLARYAADEFGTVLSREDLARFLDLAPGAAPMLPVDKETRGK